MSWRTVVLTNHSKLSLRMNHLVITGEDVVTIPLTEIGQLVIENPNIVLTGHLMNALSKYKIMTIVCDEKHLPMSQIQLIYGHFRQAKMIQTQLNWKPEKKDRLWQSIVKHKIFNQKVLLEHYFPEKDYKNFNTYIADVELNDDTNREGHAAKVYFNQLFGKTFIRGRDTPINWGLNYGYSLLMTLFTRAIVTKGLLTEVGIHHRSQYNHYNLASDFMEVYRPMIDRIVKDHIIDEFTKENKRALLNVFNIQVWIKNRKQYLANSIDLYVDSLIKFLEKEKDEELAFPKIIF